MTTAHKCRVLGALTMRQSEVSELAHRAVRLLPDAMSVGAGWSFVEGSSVKQVTKHCEKVGKRIGRGYSTEHRASPRTWKKRSSRLALRLVLFFLISFLRSSLRC